MLRRLLLGVLFAGSLAGFAAPAAADDDSRYGEWRRDGAGTAEAGALEALARELRALIDEAESARAADPRFLQDLRDRIAAHVAETRPRTALIRDDFSDGDYADDPSWTVVSGDFSVDERRGLLTVVPTDQSEVAKADDPLDAILDTGSELLEASADALDDLLGAGTKDEKEDAGPAGPEPAEISLATVVPNAFVLELEMTSRIARKGAQLEIDVFQLTSDYAGYRLSYMPGSAPALLLSRFGRRGVVEIGEHRAKLTLEDGHSHTLALARGSDGTMTATVDGTELIRVRSSAFKDSFDGVALVNGGGDYAIRSIAVYGAR